MILTNHPFRFPKRKRRTGTQNQENRDTNHAVTIPAAVLTIIQPVLGYVSYKLSASYKAQNPPEIASLKKPIIGILTVAYAIFIFSGKVE